MSSGFSLDFLPPIFVLNTHLSPEDLLQVEDDIFNADGKLTYHPSEARLFIGSINQKKRAMFDLRRHQVWTEELSSLKARSEPERKRRRIDTEASSQAPDLDPELTESDESCVEVTHPDRKVPQKQLSSNTSDDEDEWNLHADHILVLKVEWLKACIAENSVLSPTPYVVYRGRITNRPSEDNSTPLLTESVQSPFQRNTNHATDLRDNPAAVANSTILERVAADDTTTPSSANRRRFDQSYGSSSSFRPNRSPVANKAHLSHPHQPPKIHRVTTAEYEADRSPSPTKQSLKEMPNWVKEHNVYSCQRRTPPNPPNASFVAQLRKIKEVRLLTLDEIGVRAYSTAIATISAYPYLIESDTEIANLPGCGAKFAALWTEWHNSSTLR